MWRPVSGTVSFVCLAVARAGPTGDGIHILSGVEAPKGDALNDVVGWVLEDEDESPVRSWFGARRESSDMFPAAPGVDCAEIAAGVTYMASSSAPDASKSGTLTRAEILLKALPNDSPSPSAPPKLDQALESRTVCRVLRSSYALISSRKALRLLDATSLISVTREPACRSSHPNMLVMRATSSSSSRRAGEEDDCHKAENRTRTASWMLTSWNAPRRSGAELRETCVARITLAAPTARSAEKRYFSSTRPRAM